MNIFGNNWDNHAEKIMQNWIKKVKKNDTVILPGDFSWATYLNETYEDFLYLNKLPGKKILLKGNHDYWWTTINKMNNFIKENNFEDIYFLQNNSYLVEEKIICGNRGWSNIINQENYKFQKREYDRLKFSIEDGIKNFGNNKEIIVFTHYPPFYKEEVPDEINYIKLMKNYNIKRCFYGHLHGEAHKEAIEGMQDGIEFRLVSSDYLNFDLIRV